MDQKKKTSSLKNVLRLLRESRISKGRVFIIILIILGSRICLTIAPDISGKITNMIVAFGETKTMDMDKFLMKCLVLALLYLAGRGCDSLISTILLGISQKTVKNLRDKAYIKLNHLPISYLDKHPVGDLISRLTNDMQSISSLIENSMRILVSEGILMIGVFIMMLRISVMLTLIYLCMLPIGLGISAFIIHKCTGYVRRQTFLLGKLSSKTEDSYRNHSIVKAYGCGKEMLSAFDEINTDLSRQYTKTSFLAGFIMPVSVLTINICYILECILGGFFLINGSISLGDFQAFLIYGNMVLTPLTDLSVAFNGIQMGKVSAERVYELLDQEEEDDESSKKDLDVREVKGEIEFQHVKFGYSPEKILMKDVNFRANSGKTIAIVGPTGAGKTTLVNLLMRFYEINDGSILLDHTDIREYKKQTLRKAFGMVLQDSWIFDGTIMENISYGRNDITTEEVKEIARKSYCDTFINQMPQQYETYIHTNQMSLSAGERQLISIARAMVLDPPILILDEATSCMDTRTEVLITNAMTNLMKNRTCFIIAHRLTTIRNADLILYMENGDIMEAGDHDSLIKMQGRYAKLYNEAIGSGFS